MQDVFKALADPTRRRILELLREREMTAGEIATYFSVSKPTLSGHFTILRAADPLGQVGDGRQRIGVEDPQFCHHRSPRGPPN